MPPALESVLSAYETRPIHCALKDQSGRSFYANYDWVKRTPSQCFITVGWNMFCLQNYLTESSEIILCIDKADPGMVHAKIVKIC